MPRTAGQPAAALVNLGVSVVSRSISNVVPGRRRPTTLRGAPLSSALEGSSLLLVTGEMQYIRAALSSLYACCRRELDPSMVSAQKAAAPGRDEGRRAFS